MLATKELRVLTLYSSTSYFLYRGEEMGYEFELARRFALSQGLHIKVIVAENTSKLIEMLEKGQGSCEKYRGRSRGADIPADPASERVYRDTESV